MELKRVSRSRSWLRSTTGSRPNDGQVLPITMYLYGQKERAKGQIENQRHDPLYHLRISMTHSMASIRHESEFSTPFYDLFFKSKTCVEAIKRHNVFQENDESSESG
jgi:hypothetical protein